MSGAQGGAWAPPASAILRRLRGAGGVYRLPVYAASTILTLLISYSLGKDMLWDTLDYHLYSGFSAFHDRFAQDYFAAGPASYFNPYAYAPFYLLVSNASALVSASALAVVHSTILWLTYELALCICPPDEGHTSIAVGIWAVALALLNPVLIEQIGSSYADITTAALVLLGWLLLLRSLPAPRAWLPLCAGLALGAATAFKLTNALHAIAAFGLLIALPRPLTMLRSAVSYAAGGTVSFAIVTTPWAWRLGHSFGNPFFPLFNNVFRSPEFITAPLRHFRFIPAGFTEALWRPFAIADPVPMVQVEPSAPDLRYAALLVLLALLLAQRVWKRRGTLMFPVAPASPAGGRARAALLCALAIAWGLWLSASGNARYFLPMASVTAVLVAALAFRIGAGRRWLCHCLLAVIVAAQALEVCVGSEYRWSPVPWGGPWFQVDVPPKLVNEANLYLTMGVQTNSFLAPYLAPDSGLINFNGDYLLSSRGATGARIAALIGRYSPHLRVLLRGARLYEKNERRAPQRTTVDEALARFGLRVDPTDCATISVHGVPADSLSIIRVGSEPLERSPPDTLQLVSCHLVADDTDHRAQMARERSVDRVFDHLEEACPQLFQPRGLLSEHIGDSRWQRRYLDTDLRAWISGGELRFVDSLHGEEPVDLGRESDWENAPLPLVCGRRGSHYFARPLNVR